MSVGPSVGHAFCVPSFVSVFIAPGFRTKNFKFLPPPSGIFVNVSFVTTQSWGNGLIKKLTDEIKKGQRSCKWTVANDQK